MNNEHDTSDQNSSNQEREDFIRRRANARKQFKSPWFIMGLILILVVLIVPRCMYKDNVRKNIERELNQNEKSNKNFNQKNIGEEEAGMVPKF